MRFRRLSVYLVLVFLFCCTVPSLAAPTWQEEVSELLFEAMTKQTPLPSLSIAPELRTPENAYEIQALLTERLLKHNGDSVAGFKGALTAQPQMQRFKATTPAVAPLFKSGFIEAGSSNSLSLKPFKGMMLETELAFKVAAPITGSVADEEALKTLITSVHPAIEVPQLFFADMPSVDFFEIVASEIGSKLFIVGEGHPIKGTDLDTIQVVLTRNGESVNEGKGSDALGGQWKALLWLVNATLERGYKIEAGQYLMTGALGKMIPAQPGAYEARYPFASLAFIVEE